jgi:hypothetical protein
MISLMSVSYLFPPEDSTTPATTSFPQPKRNTKAVGDLSEIMVIAALIRHGYLVSIPFGENHRYDLIADNGERLLRIRLRPVESEAASSSICAAAAINIAGPAPQRAVRTSGKSNT